MMHLPDCRICREDYDLGQRLPVVLTCCGCYICKECARQLNTCPHCYKGIKRFVTNLALRDLIEMQRGLQADRAICPQHHQPLSLLCKSDNQSCCAMCFLTTHRDHEYEVLPTQTDAPGTVVSMPIGGSFGGYETSTSPCTPASYVGAAAPAAAVDGGGVSAVHVIFPKPRSEPPSIPAQTEWRPSFRTRFRGFLSSVCAIVSSLIPVIIIVVVLMSLG